MRVRATIFWLLILGSAVVLWRTPRTDSNETLWVGVFVVPFVLLTLWFRGRFSGARKRMAEVAIFSVCGMLVTSALATWSFVLISNGYGSHRNLLQGVIGFVAFVTCCSFLAWSILRLRKLPS